VVSRLGDTRHIDQWHRPLHTGSLLSIPLRIRFPNSELRPRLGPTAPEKNVIWRPAPPPDHAVDVTCNFTSQAFEPGDWPWRTEGGFQIASTVLHNGDAFWIIVRLYRTPPGLNLYTDFHEQGITLNLNGRRPREHQAFVIHPRDFVTIWIDDHA
jgi:hypothetical protein